MNHNFGWAIDMLHNGKKVVRSGWNGKGMFLYYVPEGIYPARVDAIKGYFDSDLVPYGAYIAMKTAQGNVIPWLASQTDMLADDWMEYGGNSKEEQIKTVFRIITIDFAKADDIILTDDELETMVDIGFYNYNKVYRE